MQQAVAWLRKGELVATGHATHTLQLCEKQDYLRHSVITDRGTPSFECIAVSGVPLLRSVCRRHPPYRGISSLPAGNPRRTLRRRRRAPLPPNSESLYGFRRCRR